MRNDPANIQHADRLGFVKNTPFNFEDMVKKLVYKKEVEDIRKEMKPKVPLKINSEVVDVEKKKIECLNRIYEKGKQMQEESVSKYEMIYQMNKRNIMSSDNLSDNQVGSKEKFYKEYFEKVHDERELSAHSGFALSRRKHISYQATSQSKMTDLYMVYINLKACLN